MPDDAGMSVPLGRGEKTLYNKNYKNWNVFNEKQANIFILELQQSNFIMAIKDLYFLYTIRCRKMSPSWTYC